MSSAMKSNTVENLLGKFYQISSYRRSDCQWHASIVTFILPPSALAKHESKAACESLSAKWPWKIGITLTRPEPISSTAKGKSSNARGKTLPICGAEENSTDLSLHLCILVLRGKGHEDQPGASTNQLHILPEKGTDGKGTFGSGWHAKDCDSRQGIRERERFVPAEKCSPCLPKTDDSLSTMPLSATKSSAWLMLSSW